MSKKVLLNYDQLDALMQFRVTKEFVADYMGISQDSLDRRIKEDHGLTFHEYNKLKMQRTATKLQQKAVEGALRGNTTLMIFCLKNLAGWSDKVENTNQDVSKKDVEQLKNEAKELLKEIES